MKILMIGGSGIISSEICNLSICNGDSVTIFNRGKRKEIINSSANLIVGDIRNEDTEVIKEKLEHSYDVVIDFISYTPIQLKKTLDIAADRCKQFVFVSSATAYSPEENIPYDEDTKSENHLWRYAQDKADCEKYLREVSLPCYYTIIRPYITYGHTRIPYQIIPIEYYTLINRIKCHKPIMICNADTECTLTNAKDFAVGAYGLLLNSKAYGEAFHITGDYRTTWGNVIRIIAQKLQMQANIIDIPYDYIKAHRNECGFDADEILGDKGRNMIFNNSKIKSVVPYFKDFRCFEDSIEDSIKYFNDPIHQVINFRWDADMDRFIEKYAKNKGISMDFTKLTIHAYGTGVSKEQIKVYQDNRTVARKFISKVKRKLIRK